MTELGINFPWVSCGHDFGPRPPAWGGGSPRDWGEVERELVELRALGLTITRWWILAGGTNYPVGEDPTDYATLDATGEGRLHAVTDAVLGSRVGDVARRAVELERYRAFVRTEAPLPALPDAFLDDFRGLLGACERAGVRVVPSLLSFEMFQPAIEVGRGVVKRGRKAFVFDDLGGFLDGTLARLLDAAADHRDAVFAFEVVNEPDWAVTDGPIQLDRRAYGWAPSLHWVTPDEMSDLIVRAVERIDAADFVATVGFEDGHAPWLREDALARLRTLAARGRYVHQHHHYPTLLGDRRLVAADSLPLGPCMLGEFPTAMANGADNARWLDAAHERDPERYLEGRLALIAERGYAQALLWSVRSEDSRRAWGDAQKAQVARFASDGG